MAKKFIPEEKTKCLGEIRENLRAVFCFEFNSEDKSSIKKIKGDFLKQLQDLSGKYCVKYSHSSG